MAVSSTTTIKRKTLKRAPREGSRLARKINLQYVSDKMPGISRTGSKANFVYHYEHSKREVRDAATIKRIQSLVIPPAWEKVWICRKPNGHLQATGYDVKNRKQYRYHPVWSETRNQTKFYHLIDFGNSLPGLRKQVAKDLRLPGLPRQKVLALIVQLMERTHIRIGNAAYEKMNGSFGLTTLKDRHVDFKDQTVRFKFKGKKGVRHEINLKNKKLAQLVKQCRDIPGQELFQYFDEDGNHYSVDSGMVNEYIREHCGEEFSAKDFRTWTGSVEALSYLIDKCECETKKEKKQHVIGALDAVSEMLGNTRSVCKKYYVCPLVVELYEESKLGKLDRKLSAEKGLDAEEKLLLYILEND